MSAPLDHAARAKGLGGSDIGAIAGLSPYKSAIDVWMAKTGQAEDQPCESEPAYWGHALEDVIAARYANETGRALTSPGLIVHPTQAWRLGNPDRLVPSDRVLLEIKTANVRQAHRWGEPGTDEIPEEYLAQVQWYLGLLPGYEVAEVPVLLGGNDYRVYRVQRNQPLIDALADLGARWWEEHIVRGVPPAVDGSESARRWLARRYPREMAPLLQSTPTIDALAAQLRDARARREAAEEEESTARHQLQALIGEAAGVEGAWGRCTWKSAKGRPSTDWDAIAQEVGIPAELIERHTRRTPYRVFRPTFKEE